MNGIHAPNRVLDKKPISVLLVLVALVVLWWILGTDLQLRKKTTTPPPTLSNADIAALLLEQNHPITAPVMWVTIENREPIANTNTWFVPHATCVTREDGEIGLVSVEEGHLLVRYNIRYKSGGTACPDGTLFVLSTRDATLSN